LFSPFLKSRNSLWAQVVAQLAGFDGSAENSMTDGRGREEEEKRGKEERRRERKEYGMAKRRF
jgi:hypothetical protein